MRTPSTLPLAFAATLALAACTTTRTPVAAVPPLDSRLSRNWLSSVSRIRSGQRTVFYHGTAQRTPGTSRSPWQGIISGDILVLSPTDALVSPSGTVGLGAGNRITVNGPHRINLVAPGEGQWQHLLQQ